MNPQQNQTPLDYLNQIAPKEQKPGFFQLSMRTVLFGAGILVVLVIIIALVVGALSNAQKEPWQQLSVRLDVTATAANDATTKLKNSQLRSLNSDLKLYLSNTTRDLAEPLAKRGIEAKKIPASITAKENGTGMADRLEDARLNAKYDSTYAREMSYQLATLLALYQELYAGGGSDATKTFLTTAYDNLQPTQKALESFSAANE